MNNEISSKIFDLVLADALMESLDIELMEIENDHEYDDYKFSSEFDNKIKKIARSIGKRDRITSCRQIFLRSIVTVAAIMGIVFCGLLTQPDVSAAVQNVIRTIFDKYDKYEYIGEELSVDNFNNNIRLGYVPDGYRLTHGDYLAATVSLVYKNIDENKIMFDYSIADGTSSNYDNEHNTYSSFIINGTEYQYYKSNDKDFYDMLVWYEDGYAFSILAHLSEDELVKIAENIK